LICGSLGILSLYNLSLFFTQRDKSSLAFLSYVVCILIWLNISLVNVTSKMDRLDGLELNLDALAEEANLIVKAAQECINQSID
jgi:hypothetical protein